MSCCSACSRRGARRLGKARARPKRQWHAASRTWLGLGSGLGLGFGLGLGLGLGSGSGLGLGLGSGL
eukprot:scaffold38423_cov45-Phaeocystis_antarctica.AAC.1